jgi:ATP-dependent Lhr-like helicase
VSTTSADGPAKQRNGFDRLAPFIQEFIWKHNWTELRGIQVQAANAAFDTDKHILLASGTASGKTEAAFLPVLTQLHNDPATSVGALYIGPLKALINDQFIRLNDLCVDAGIPVTAWHGDIGASKKHALLKHPAGILQITPEALEGLLLNRPAHLLGLFGDLRWVVIDEIHALMVSDRGGQVLALLDRLARYASDQRHLPRRIGLSATLGDYTQAALWLGGASSRGVEVITEHNGRNVNLLVDQFTEHRYSVPRIASAAADSLNIVPHSVKPEDGANDADKLLASYPAFFDAAFDATRRGKSIIFVNRRSDAEEMIIGLRRLAEQRNSPDIYHIHHGSIATVLREDAEMAMRDENRPACIAATVTLELGIDLGQLDRVLQVGPTFTVASFLQRLGRCGRRGQPPEMLFLLREDATDGTELLFKLIPWELLQTIALIQLYAEEKWIEPVAWPTFPGSLLYQQTMSVIGAAGELSPAQLAERVLTLAPFRNVTLDEFRELLHHLLAIDHLERTGDEGLILGLEGEKIVRNFRFLATFEDPTEWSVKDGSRDIGTVGTPIPIGERFILAGRTWEVVDVISAQHLMIVKRIRGGVKSAFIGGGTAEVHDRVVRRMRQVLAEDVKYPYLTERAAARLEQARKATRAADLASYPGIIPISDTSIVVLPWCGSRVLNTLEARFNTINGVTAMAHSFFVTISVRPQAETSGWHGSKSTAGISELEGETVDLNSLLSRLAEEPWSVTDLVDTMDRVLCERAKYDQFLPERLLKQSFSSRYLDVPGAYEALKSAVPHPMHDTALTVADHRNRPAIISDDPAYPHYRGAT